MPAYHPPFQLTHRMTALVADIAERLGAWKAANRATLVPALRRGNRIRALQTSLAIEQNTLSVEQVTAPFRDGNGRMGRSWQTLILSHWQPMLAWLPVESLIKHRQRGYYAQLARADAHGDCSRFVEFMLQAIADSLDEAIANDAPVQTSKRTPDLVLALLRRRPQLTLAEIAGAIDRSLRTVERTAARLQAEGRLRCTGPKKGGRWWCHERGSGGAHGNR